MSVNKTRFSRRRFLGSMGAGVAGLVAARAAVFGRSPAKPRMSHRERIEKALALAETDRLPFGFWWHFPNQDRAPRRLAQLSLELQQRLDLDFIKFSPYGLYSVVDWGVTLDVRGGKQPPVQAEYPIQRPDDWCRLRPWRGTEGEYLIVLEAQRIALAEMREHVPLVQTVFSPLTSALKLAGPAKLLTHLREAPSAVHAALEIILLLDSWHWYTAHDTKADLLALSGREIIACHLNDAPVGVPVDEQVDGKRELPCATGVIDLKTFLGALVQIGYDGPVCAEPFSKKLSAMPKNQALQSVAAAMKAAVALVE